MRQEESDGGTINKEIYKKILLQAHFTQYIESICFQFVGKYIPQNLVDIQKRCNMYFDRPWNSKT